MKEELLRVLREFPNKRILVIGDVMLDKYIYGDVDRISPEAPVPVLKVKEEYFKAGGAGNVAVNVANLSSSKVSLFGFVGKDMWAEDLKKILNEKNIKSHFETNTSTILKERIIGHSSGQQQHIVRIDREEMHPKKFNEVKQILFESAERADIILISDYAKGAITLDLMNSLSNYKNKMIIDPKPKNNDFKTIYKNALLITPNRSEALKMSGCTDIYDAGYKLKQEFNSNILITLGKQGMILFPVSGEKLDISTIPEESFEETGAGDTAISAIALSLAVDKSSIQSFENAAQLGNLAAGITVKKFGVYAPKFEELEQKLIQKDN